MMLQVPVELSCHHNIAWMGVCVKQWSQHSAVCQCGIAGNYVSGSDVCAPKNEDCPCGENTHKCALYFVRRLGTHKYTDFLSPLW